MKKRKRSEIQNIIHEELVDQLIGALSIEIENWVYYTYNIYGGSIDFHKTSYGGYYGLDIYIKDNRFEENGRYEDICSLNHLHPEDILWAILNIDTIIQHCKDRYKKYMEVKDGGC